jgi:hypothetical protein
MILIVGIESCSNLESNFSPEKTYKMDINIKNKEFEGVGVLVLPKKELYTMTISAPDSKMDMISFRSCSRETISTNTKEFVINYRPNEIEKLGNCPITIASINKDNSFNLGFIDFEDEDNTLVGVLVCGSKTTAYNGVSICQERSSSMEKIKFGEDVFAEYEVGCNLDKKEGKEFNFKIGLGFCTYDFVTINPPHRRHRLTTFGYDSILRY